MIGLNVKADYVIHSEGEPSVEAEKLEIALREFFKYYRAESGEALAFHVEVLGKDVSWFRYWDVEKDINRIKILLIALFIKAISLIF